MTKIKFKARTPNSLWNETKNKELKVLEYINSLEPLTSFSIKGRKLFDSLIVLAKATVGANNKLDVIGYVNDKVQPKIYDKCLKEK